MDMNNEAYLNLNSSYVTGHGSGEYNKQMFGHTGRK